MLRSMAFFDRILLHAFGTMHNLPQLRWLKLSFFVSWLGLGSVDLDLVRWLDCLTWRGR